MISFNNTLNKLEDYFSSKNEYTYPSNLLVPQQSTRDFELYHDMYGTHARNYGLKNIYYNVRNHIKHKDKSRFEKDALLINSIPKSGTHYLLYLIANYLHIYFREINSQLKWEQIHGENKELILFPNSTHAYGAYRKPKPDHVILETQYMDIVWGHIFAYLRYSNAKKILHLYRNPFDFIISFYYYIWLNKRAFPDYYSLIDSSIESINLTLKYFIFHYSYIKHLSLQRNNILRISYEQLINNPQSTFVCILSWLNLPMNIEMVLKAIEFSSIQSVKRQEKLVVNKTKAFVRSGKIGEWKEFFSEKNVSYILQSLKEFDINIEEFIIE